MKSPAYLPSDHEARARDAEAKLLTVLEREVATQVRHDAKLDRLEAELAETQARLRVAEERIADWQRR